MLVNIAKYIGFCVYHRSYFNMVPRNRGVGGSRGFGDGGVSFVMVAVVVAGVGVRGRELVVAVGFTLARWCWCWWQQGARRVVVLLPAFLEANFFRACGSA